MAEMLGAKRDDINVYDKTGKLSSGSAPSAEHHHWLKVVAFDNGGHYAFKKYGDIVIQEIDNLLDRVTRELPEGVVNVPKRDRHVISEKRQERFVNRDVAINKLSKDFPIIAT